jgi:hypothetical protein
LSRCTAIKASGDRCKGRAIEGSEWCWNHNPAHADERRRHGAKGGKRGGRGRPQAELQEAKQLVRGLAAGVLQGTIDRSDAAVCGQLYNVYLRAVSVELKAREQLELVERLEAIETVLEQRKREAGRGQLR